MNKLIVLIWISVVLWIGKNRCKNYLGAGISNVEKCTLKTCWWPSAVVFYLVGLLSLWHIPHFHSQFYWILIKQNKDFRYLARSKSIMPAWLVPIPGVLMIHGVLLRQVFYHKFTDAVPLFKIFSSLWLVLGCKTRITPSSNRTNCLFKAYFRRLKTIYTS